MTLEFYTATLWLFVCIVTVGGAFRTVKEDDHWALLVFQLVLVALTPVCVWYGYHNAVAVWGMLTCR
jgi:hypothetical protein